MCYSFNPIRKNRISILDVPKEGFVKLLVLLSPCSYEKDIPCTACGRGMLQEKSYAADTQQKKSCVVQRITRDFQLSWQHAPACCEVDPPACHGPYHSVILH